MNSLSEDVKSFKQILNAGDIVQIALRMLTCINKEVTAHSIRTAFIALNIARVYKMNKKCNLTNLIFLSFFHAIGYYREEPFFNYTPHDSKLTFFSDDKSITSKYMFSSFYLEYMTPLREDARALTTFNKPYDKELSIHRYQEDYKSIIYFSARISDYIANNPDLKLPDDLNRIAPGYFNPDVVEAFNKVNTDGLIVQKIKTDNHKQMLSEFLFSAYLPVEDTKLLQSLLVYFLDFKSTQTMQHAVNTSCYCILLGRRLHFTNDELSDLYLSALLHDIGKIATPQHILEFPGRLSPEDMGIMRHHVNHSKRILTGFVPYRILMNVYRHHEKLNGQGYPKKIMGDEISMPQRVLTVADITSALHDSRSYKEGYSKEKIISIITDMINQGELDVRIADFVISDYDQIMEEQKIVHELVKVDFSKVLEEYNNYLLNDNADDLEEVDLVEESTDLEELEEL